MGERVERAAQGEAAVVAVTVAMEVEVAWRATEGRVSLEAVGQFAASPSKHFGPMQAPAMSRHLH